MNTSTTPADREVTEAMLAAGKQAWDEYVEHVPARVALARIYRAMRAAQPPGEAVPAPVGEREALELCPYSSGASQSVWLAGFRAALASRAATPPAVPVATVTVSHFRGDPAMENRDFDYFGSLPPGTHSLYASPPPLGVPVRMLTDEEIDAIRREHAPQAGIDFDVRCRAFARAVLAASTPTGGEGGKQ